MRGTKAEAARHGVSVVLARYKCPNPYTVRDALLCDYRDMVLGALNLPEEAVIRKALRDVERFSVKMLLKKEYLTEQRGQGDETNGEVG